MNDVVLNWDKIHEYLPKAKKTIEDKAYTRDQIKKMLQTATKLRAKVVILLLCSAGMRIGDLIDLKKKHLKFIYEHKLYQITVYPKEEEQYTTFCTPECATMIDSYFEFRERSGEIITKESPVIRDDFDHKLRTSAKKVEHTTITAMENLIEDIVQKSGLKMDHDNGSQRTEIMRAHGLRKFFDSILLSAKVPPNEAGKLMGWKSKRGLHSNYDRSNDLLSAYLIAINDLTINEENRLEIKVEELTAKTETNEYIINHRLQEKDSEIQTMKIKHEQDMKVMREEMENKFQQILTRIDTAKLR